MLGSHKTVPIELSYAMVWTPYTILKARKVGFCGMIQIRSNKLRARKREVYFESGPPSSFKPDREPGAILDVESSSGSPECRWSTSRLGGSEAGGADSSLLLVGLVSSEFFFWDFTFGLAALLSRRSCKVERQSKSATPFSCRAPTSVLESQSPVFLTSQKYKSRSRHFAQFLPL